MSSIGAIFRVQVFGDAQTAVGCVIEGVPPRLALSAADLQPQLSRVWPGMLPLVARVDDAPKVARGIAIVSGTDGARTVGTPLCLLVSRGLTANPPPPPPPSGDSQRRSGGPSPDQSDYAHEMKYGSRAALGDESVPDVIGRIAAGSVAEKWLFEKFGVEIVAYVSSLGALRVEMDGPQMEGLTRADVDATLPVRCGLATMVSPLNDLIHETRELNDAVGGTITCIIKNAPAGWGEPTFDKLEATLAHAVLSLRSAKGFEVGCGFAGAALHGSQRSPVNASDRSGGIHWGISSGHTIYFRVAFKPPIIAGRVDVTKTFEGADSVLGPKGRHEPTLVPHMVPLVEAMAAIALADAAMAQLCRQSSAPRLLTADPGRSLEEITIALDTETRLRKEVLRRNAELLHSALVLRKYRPASGAMHFFLGAGLAFASTLAFRFLRHSGIFARFLSPQ